MLKRLLVLSFMASASCTVPDGDRKISSDECWNEVRDGEKLSGTVKMYYFPDNAVFISNDKCPENTIGLSMSSRDKDKFRKIIKMYDKNDDFIGISIIVDISGTIYRNRKKRSPLLKANYIRVHEGKKFVEPIYIK